MDMPRTAFDCGGSREIEEEKDERDAPNWNSAQGPESIQR